MLTFTTKNLSLHRNHSLNYEIEPNFRNSKSLNSNSYRMARNFEINCIFEVVNPYWSGSKHISNQNNLSSLYAN
jgi:hypothetical protein